jgi:hypothetical protein
MKKALTIATYFLCPVPYPAAFIVHMIYGVWIAAAFQFPDRLEFGFTATCMAITVAVCAALVVLINLKRGKL